MSAFAVSGVVEVLALMGIVAVAVAYVPQVLHTWRARCCVGVSIPAWSVWTAASVLFLAYAVSIGDLAFTALLGVQLGAQATMVGLAIKHRGYACEAHGGQNNHPVGGETPNGRKRS